MLKALGFGDDDDKFDPSRLKTQMKMATSRIKIQQNKIVNSVKSQRRQLAELMSVGKYDNARVKVEAVMREDLSIEGLEALALFCDLVGNRAAVIASSQSAPKKKSSEGDGNHYFGPPPELKEAVCSILWAGERVGNLRVQELISARKMFADKYGKAFVASAIDDSEKALNDKIRERLGTSVPSNEACITYMASVAAEFGLEFDITQLSVSLGGKKPLPQSEIPSIKGGHDIDMSDVLASIDGAGGGVGVTKELPAPAGFRTKAGFWIPAIEEPRDELERKLKALLCQ